MKINSQLLRKAITDNELFCFLTGQNGYEIYFSSTYMPTDIEAVTFELAKYMKENPDFEEQIINTFIILSLHEEWCWLIIYYIRFFERQNMKFLPYDILYSNIRNHKNSLEKNSGWICFNNPPELNNLWADIKKQNQSLKASGLKVPNLL